MQIVGVSNRTYQLEDTPFAQGGQARVFGGRDPEGASIAVKIAHPSANCHAALEREIALLQWLQDKAPGVGIAYLDTVHWNGSPGVVMPRYPGHADGYVKNALLVKDGADLERILAFTARIIAGVSRLHSIKAPKGGQLIHRDLKPENVLVDPRGQPVLADLAGSTEIHPLREVREAAVGTPLWTPYEQLLAESPAANPTWDTYACCVMLFWWVTGARPTYQDDPSPMLTPIGRQIRQMLLTAAGETDRANAIAAWQKLRALRADVPAADLIDPRGHGAIQAEDEAMLVRGVRQWGARSVYGAAALETCARDLGRVLARGLSPLSHPSPPNRYWAAKELLSDVQAIRAQLVAARTRRQNRRVRRRVTLGLAATGLLGFTAVIAFRTAPTPDAPDETQRPPLLNGGSLLIEGDAAPTVIAPYRLDRYEVTNADFLACVDAQVCTPPIWAAAEVSLAVETEYTLFRGDNQPVVGVTWDQARIYCSWRGGRLPTEGEWIFAATRGGEADWPWGDAPPDCSRANTASCGLLRTVDVDALSAGESPEGIRGLIGNAYEWTATERVSGGGRLFRRMTRKHVLRGGAFDGDLDAARPTKRHLLKNDRTATDLSFRCAYSP